MTTDKQRAERIAKKARELQKHHRLPTHAIAALEEMGEEMASGVRRETVEECAPKWISVEERLPEGHYGYALIAYNNHGETYVHVSFWSRTIEDEFHWRYDEAVKSVTHWMPLPEPPEVRALLPAATKETRE